MARRYFGTDGIRGSANSTPMTSEVALRVGMAAGKLFTNGSYRHRVVIGKDTRLSGYMIESALVSGFTAVGMDVFLLGPMPTPAVAMLTRSLRADLGVMISASHNPFADNGIKLFGPDGYKLSDDTELQVEELMLVDMSDLLAAPEKIGRATRIDSARCGSLAPTWSSSASIQTASTSTRIAARPHPATSFARSMKCAPISASRSTVTPIAW